MTGEQGAPFADLSVLEAGAEALGLTLDGTQLDQFRCYGELLLATNERMNLTAITAPGQVQALHFLDALTLVAPIRSWGARAERPSPLLLDVGSGAGLPGLALKIALPELRVTLLDATGKRVRFLQETIAALDLSGIGAVQGRAEEVGRDPEWREQYDIVTARALARLPTLLEWCLPFARPGGLILSPKAGELTAELAEGARAAELLGGVVRAPLPIMLPTLPGRTIVPIDKLHFTPAQYPRGGGQPSREPLGVANDQ